MSNKSFTFLRFLLFPLKTPIKEMMIYFSTNKFKIIEFRGLNSLGVETVCASLTLEFTNHIIFHSEVCWF